jgi:hypothetical protein
MIVEISPHGDIFVRRYKQDKLHGKSVKFSEDGFTESGYFKMNNPYGKWVRILPDGAIHEYGY